MTGAVIIDVDRTLIDGESFRAFVLQRIFHASRLGAPAIIGAYLLRRLGLLTVESFKERCLADLAGHSRQELESVGSGFTERWLIPRVRPGARDTLAACRERGERVVLISGSVDLYINPLAAALGIDDFVATELEYDSGGKFSGRFAGGDCLGARRVERLRQFTLANGIDLGKSTLYSDSMNDFDLFLQVGRPVAVWPDKDLQKQCVANGWSVEYW